jgi:hypothetical protein
VNKSYLDSDRLERAYKKRYNFKEDTSDNDLLSKNSDWRNDEIKNIIKNDESELEKERQTTKLSMGIDFLKALDRTRKKTSQLKNVLSDLEDLQMDLDFHSDEIQAMANKWVEAQTELEEKKYECRHLISILKLQQRQSDRLELENNNLAKEIKRYQSELDLQREKFLQKESEINNLPLQPQYKEELISLNYDNFVSKENDFIKAKQELESNQRELQKRMQEIEELKTELLEKQEEDQLTSVDNEEITEIKEQISKMFEEIGEETTTFNELKSELAELKKQLKENQIELPNDVGAAGFLQSQLESANAEIELRNEIIRKLRKERPRVIDDYDEEYQDRYLELKDQFDVLHEDYIELKNAAKKLIEKNI